VLPPICPRHQRGACPLRSASAHPPKA
jgi:hypothetical protein